MDTSRRSTNASAEQKRLILEFIKKHPKITTGKFLNDFTQKDSQHAWEELTNLLNSCPGANKPWKAWRKTWHDIRSRTKSKKSKFLSEREKTGGGPYEQNLITTYEDEVVDIIKPVSVEGHQNVEESVADFSFDVGLASPSLHENRLESLECEPSRKVATPDQVHAEVSQTAFGTCSTVLANKVAESNGSVVQSAKKIFPKAPRKKLIYASEASENYRKSLESKNKIKRDYYEKKLVILERVAIAKEKSADAKERTAAAEERSAAVQEEIANHIGRLTYTMEGIQDAVS